MEDEIHDVFKINAFSNEEPKKDTPPPANTPVTDIEVMFNNERKEWTDKIASMSNSYRNFSKMTEVQVTAFSNRQIAVEKKHQYTSMYEDANMKYKQLKKDRIAHYTTQSARKYTNPQVDSLVDGDTAAMKRHLDSLAQQANYFDDTVRTLDHIIFAMKYRLEYERFIKADL